MVYPGRIIKLRVRGTKRDLIEDTSSEEVCVVMPGVIARFCGSEVQVSDNILPIFEFWLNFLIVCMCNIYIMLNCLYMRFYLLMRSGRGRGGGSERESSNI